MTGQNTRKYKAYSLAEVNSPEAREALLAAKIEKNIRVALIAPAYNELGKIEKIVATWPRDMVDAFLVMDDGSSDGSMDLVRTAGGTVTSAGQREGVGIAIRKGLFKARDDGFDIAVIIAGNGKDDPNEVHRLLWPIIMDGYDYVQGSRYLEGGDHSNMPVHRTLVTRAWPWLVFLFTGRKLTEATNGYRAYPLATLERAGMVLEQDGLAECIEHYIQVKVLKAGLAVAEVPVGKHYPDTKNYTEYTKVRVSKLYHRFKPFFYIPLGIWK